MPRTVSSRRENFSCQQDSSWEVQTARPMGRTPYVYVVLRKLDGVPVYVVRKIGSSKTRTLHRNMLALCPFDVPEPTCTTSSSEQENEEMPSFDCTLEEQDGSQTIPPPDGFQDVHVHAQPRYQSSEDTITEAIRRTTTGSSSSICVSSDSLEGESCGSEDERPVYRLRRLVKAPDRFGDWL